ncbi:hypothetical protein ACNO7T_22890 [Vibrio campbellii]
MTEVNSGEYNLLFCSGNLKGLTYKFRKNGTLVIGQADDCDVCTGDAELVNNAIILSIDLDDVKINRKAYKKIGSLEKGAIYITTGNIEMLVYQAGYADVSKSLEYFKYRLRKRELLKGFCLSLFFIVFVLSGLVMALKLEIGRVSVSTSYSEVAEGKWTLNEPDHQKLSAFGRFFWGSSYITQTEVNVGKCLPGLMLKDMAGREISCTGAAVSQDGTTLTLLSPEDLLDGLSSLYKTQGPLEYSYSNGHKLKVETKPSIDNLLFSQLPNISWLENSKIPGSEMIKLNSKDFNVGGYFVGDKVSYVLIDGQKYSVNEVVPELGVISEITDSYTIFNSDSIEYIAFY